MNERSWLFEIRYCCCTVFDFLLSFMFSYLCFCCYCWFCCPCFIVITWFLKYNTHGVTWLRTSQLFVQNFSCYYDPFCMLCHVTCYDFTHTFTFDLVSTKQYLSFFSVCFRCKWASWSTFLAWVHDWATIWTIWTQKGTEWHECRRCFHYRWHLTDVIVSIKLVKLDWD